MNNFILEYEILNLDKFTCNKLIDKKVRIYLTRKDLEKQEYVGIICEVSLSSNEPHKPFDITIELEGGNKTSFGIIGINKIEFLE